MSYEQGLDLAVDKLIEQIKASQTYSNYTEQKEKAGNAPDIDSKMKRIREVHKKLVDLTEQGIEGYEYEQLEGQYEELCEDTAVYEYMQAELGFCRMFQDILAKITASIEFE